MSHMVKLAFTVIVFMDIAAGILSMLSMTHKCKHDESPDNTEILRFGVAATILLGFAHAMVNLVGGCHCIAFIDLFEEVPRVRRWMFACLILSWIDFAAGFPILIIGIVAANQSARNLCTMSEYNILAGGICCFIHGFLSCIWCCIFTFATTQLPADAADRRLDPPVPPC